MSARRTHSAHRKIEQPRIALLFQPSTHKIDMTRNTYVLFGIAALLGAAYVWFFTDLFTRETIQIIPQIRPGRPSNVSRSGDAPPVYPVSFLFDGKYKLTSLKVVSAQELATNKYANPAWHLISDSNSMPTKN